MVSELKRDSAAVDGRTKYSNYNCERIQAVAGRSFHRMETVANLIGRISFGAHCTQRLMVALLPVIALVCGCNGGSDTAPSGYGSTLLVTYYSDSDCGSEFGTPGSRFSVPTSGETACTTHSTFNHVSLSVKPSDVTCDPANPSGCTVGGRASIGYKVGCNDDCSVC